MIDIKRAAAVLAGGVAVTTVIGLSAAGAAQAKPVRTHPAATAACGFSCFTLSSLQTPNDVQNAYIPHGNGLAVTGKVGGKVNMKVGDDSYRQEDFTDNTPGMTVSDFCAPPGFPLASGQEWLATNYICIHDGSDPVYEANFSPDGDETGLCVGVAAGTVSGQNVTLQPCGETVRTLWVADRDNAHVGATPWISGANTNFSHALVLTEDVGSHAPQNQLFVRSENLLTHGFVDNDQEFTVSFGPYI